MEKIFVSKNESADYNTIQSAIDSVRVFPLEEVTIYVANGVYQEKITIPENKPNIHIIGESSENTIVSFDDYAEKVDSIGKKLGTFRTATAMIHANDFTLRNITIRNSAGYGKEIGQAVALYLSGDRCRVYNARLLGNQDTLYTSQGRQFFSGCYVEGHVDFIFGAATAVFKDCEIHSLREGYITAASTPENQKYGFIFFNCKLTGSAKERTVYLGRPWRPYAHTLFINCSMESHIKLEGWDNWRNPENEQTARYGEYQSFGVGFSGDKRVDWAKQLTRADINKITKIFHVSDEWIPE